MGRLTDATKSRASSSTVAIDPAGSGRGDLAARLDEVIRRLEALEKSIVARNEASDQLAELKLRDKLREQYRAEDGSAIAEELLAQGKFAAGANGILAFLESHPDHPDTRRPRRARNAFQQSLPRQGALVRRDHEEVRASRRDLYQLPKFEKRMKK